MKSLIKVELNYAPKTGDGFDKWCEDNGFVVLTGSGRRAWNSNLQAYLRDALGVATTENGESFIFYEDDIQVESEATK